MRPLQLEKSSWRNVVAAVWGVGAERGTFLCWSEKEQSEGKKGESEGGKSSRVRPVRLDFLWAESYGTERTAAAHKCCGLKGTARSPEPWRGML